jgi:ribonuclease BN (tRNA processing enzyme)
MKVTIVGCSGSFPGPASPSSCYLVEHDDARILLDMGNGSLGHLQRFADIYAVDAVVLSHLHVDHFIDLCSFYVALRYRPQGPAPVVPVWGPEGTSDRLVTAYGLPSGTGMNGELDIRQIATSFEIGPFAIETARMMHPIESRAIRVTAGGRSLTYSGDTGPTPALAELARGSDLALFEASFVTGGDNPPDLHLTGAEAGEAAAAAGVGRLVLTHLVPWNSTERVLSEAAPAFPEAELARPGLSIEL